MSNMNTDELIGRLQEEADKIEQSKNYIELNEVSERTSWLQLGLDRVGFHCASDGMFGRLTEAELEEFQFSRMLSADYKAGAQTLRELAECLEKEWDLGTPFLFRGFEVLGGVHLRRGKLPGRYGRMSTFGGPDDVNDRMYGQALVPASSAEALYSRHADLVKLGLFVEGATDPLPMTTDWNGKEVRAGISYLLNPESYFCAMRWLRYGRPDPSFDRVIFICGDLAVCTAPTDFGPAASLDRVADMSHGAADALYLKPDDNLELTTDSKIWCCWGKSCEDLGPMAKAA